MPALRTRTENAGCQTKHGYTQMWWVQVNCVAQSFAINGLSSDGLLGVCPAILVFHGLVRPARDYRQYLLVDEDNGVGEFTQAALVHNLL